MFKLRAGRKEGARYAMETAPSKRNNLSEGKKDLVRETEK